MLLSFITSCTPYAQLEDEKVEPFSPRNIEVDYDLHCTPLFHLIQQEDWEKAEEIAITHPEQICIWVNRYDDDPPTLRWRMLPIHALCIFSGTRRLVRLFLDIYPESASMTDDQDMLPIHLACRKGADVGVVEELWDAFPDGLGMKDYKGRTPLDLAKASLFFNKGQIIALLTNCSETEDCEQRQVTEISEDREGGKQRDCPSIGDGGSNSSTESEPLMTFLQRDDSNPVAATVDAQATKTILAQVHKPDRSKATSRVHRIAIQKQKASKKLLLVKVKTEQMRLWATTTPSPHSDRSTSKKFDFKGILNSRISARERMTERIIDPSEAAEKKSSSLLDTSDDMKNLQTSISTEGDVVEVVQDVEVENIGQSTEFDEAESNNTAFSREELCQLDVVQKSKDVWDESAVQIYESDAMNSTQTSTSMESSEDDTCSTEVDTESGSTATSEAESSQSDAVQVAQDAREETSVQIYESDARNSTQTSTSLESSVDDTCSSDVDGESCTTVISAVESSPLDAVHVTHDAREEISVHIDELDAMNSTQTSTSMESSEDDTCSTEVDAESIITAISEAESNPLDAVQVTQDAREERSVHIDKLDAVIRITSTPMEPNEENTCNSEVDAERSTTAFSEAESNPLAAVHVTHDVREEISVHIDELDAMISNQTSASMESSEDDTCSSEVDAESRITAISEAELNPFDAVEVTQDVREERSVHIDELDAMISTSPSMESSEDDSRSSEVDARSCSTSEAASNPLDAVQVTQDVREESSVQIYGSDAMSISAEKIEGDVASLAEFVQEENTIQTRDADAKNNSAPFSEATLNPFDVVQVTEDARDETAVYIIELDAERNRWSPHEAIAHCDDVVNPVANEVGTESSEHSFVEGGMNEDNSGFVAENEGSTDNISDDLNRDVEVLKEASELDQLDSGAPKDYVVLKQEPQALKTDAGLELTAEVDLGHTENSSETKCFLSQVGTVIDQAEYHVVDGLAMPLAVDQELNERAKESVEIAVAIDFRSNTVDDDELEANGVSCSQGDSAYERAWCDSVEVDEDVAAEVIYNMQQSECVRDATPQIGSEPERENLEIILANSEIEVVEISGVIDLICSIDCDDGPEPKDPTSAGEAVESNENDLAITDSLEHVNVATKTWLCAKDPLSIENGVDKVEDEVDAQRSGEIKSETTPTIDNDVTEDVVKKLEKIVDHSIRCDRGESNVEAAAPQDVAEVTKMSTNGTEDEERSSNFILETLPVDDDGTADAAHDVTSKLDETNGISCDQSPSTVGYTQCQHVAEVFASSDGAIEEEGDAERGGVSKPETAAVADLDVIEDAVQKLGEVVDDVNESINCAQSQNDADDAGSQHDTEVSAGTVAIESSRFNAIKRESSSVEASLSTDSALHTVVTKVKSEEVSKSTEEEKKAMVIETTIPAVTLREKLRERTSDGRIRESTNEKYAERIRERLFVRETVNLHQKQAVLGTHGRNDTSSKVASIKKDGIQEVVNGTESKEPKKVDSVNKGDQSKSDAIPPYARFRSTSTAGYNRSYYLNKKLEAKEKKEEKKEEPKKSAIPPYMRMRATSAVGYNRANYLG